MEKPERDPPDFEMLKYEIDRNHELELNKFLHALEIERLKILQLVNGGAFTVLVAFAAGLMHGPGWSRLLAITAGLAWVLGLGAAALATHRQLNAQAAYNAGYRHRRNAVEFRKLAAIYGEAGAVLMLPPLEGALAKRQARRDRWHNGTAASGAPHGERVRACIGHAYDERADAALFAGRAGGRHVKALAIAGMLFFMLGGGLLAGSLALADPPPLASAEKAAQ